MSSKKVLYISQEIFPYLPKTEISEISRKLPQFIQEKKNDVRMFMPRYGLVNERRSQLHEVIRLSGLNLSVNDLDYSLIIKVSSIPAARLQAYFIHCDDFFKRKSLYGKANAKASNDNDARSIFFIRGVLETVKRLRWIPDVIHCHGAFTALAMVYLKSYYKEEPCLQNAKLVYSVYKEEEPVEMPDTLFDTLKFDNIEGALVEALEGKTDFTSLTKLAIAHADGVVQASQEINEDVKAYALAQEKPFLEYPGAEDYADAYNDFYNNL